MMSHAEFKREYCTVSINVGRQTGKSTYIKNYAEKDDLIIYRHHHDAHFFDFSVSDRIAASGITSIKLEGKKYKNIYIDNASLIYNLSMFYMAFANDDIDQTFILLG